MSSYAKVQKTCRIRLTKAYTIYCSYKMVQEVRSLLVKGEVNVYLPLKGKADELLSKVMELAQENPDHFSGTAHAILGTTKYLNSFKIRQQQKKVAAGS